MRTILNCVQRLRIVKNLLERERGKGKKTLEEETRDTRTVQNCGQRAKKVRGSVRDR